MRSMNAVPPGVPMSRGLKRWAMKMNAVTPGLKPRAMKSAVPMGLDDRDHAEQPRVETPGYEIGRPDGTEIKTMFWPPGLKPWAMESGVPMGLRHFRQLEMELAKFFRVPGRLQIGVPPSGDTAAASATPFQGSSFWYRPLRMRITRRERTNSAMYRSAVRWEIFRNPAALMNSLERNS